MDVSVAISSPLHFSSIACNTILCLDALKKSSPDVYRILEYDTACTPFKCTLPSPFNASQGYPIELAVSVIYPLTQ